MRIRGIRWPFLWFFLLSFCIFAIHLHATQTPLLPHSDPSNEREFQNVYQTISKSPSVYSGSGTPTKAPVKLGDFYINTSTSKVYIATGTATSGSWTALN